LTRLLIALGNPGKRYELTRHNAGFWVLDELARDAGANWDASSADKFLGHMAKGQVLGEACILLKPMTFMNLSGRSVLKVAQFFKIPSQDWIVLHDDIDVPSSKVRARAGGGHGGHNGIRSIMEESGRDDFQRVKLGVGRPPKLEDGSPTMDVADYVLRPMPLSEVADYVKAVKSDVELRMKEMFRQRK
jgi:PTH1 family peptidyl-tRNA hydrolase